MTIQNIIYQLFIFITLANIYGCQSKVTTEDSFQRKPSTEKPAVLYRSNDLGKIWSAFAKGIPSEATLSGIQQDGNKIYIATDYHGVFISQEGENNWIALNEKFLNGLDINCIEVDGNHLVIGTLNKGVFVSSDGGLNWSSPKENINAPIRAFLKSEDLMYAGTDAGIFRSNDLGNTWSPVTDVMQILGFTPLNGKTYAATQNGVIMLKSAGSDWKSIYGGDALHDIGNDGTYIYAMTIGQELLKTKNEGLTWENAQNGIPRPPNFYTNELHHIGKDIFSAQWIGIYHSQNNGETWKILNGLPDATAFSTLEITDYGIVAGISIR